MHKNYPGWPAGNALPQKFGMTGGLVVEPDLKRDDPGAIYIRARDLDGEQIVARACRLWSKARPSGNKKSGAFSQTEKTCSKRGEEF